MIGLDFRKFYLVGNEQPGDLINCYCANRYNHGDITREQLIVIDNDGHGTAYVKIRTNNPDLHFKSRMMKEEIKKPKLIICQGVPASGKTTWAKEFISKKQQAGDFSWIRVNRDDLRNSTGVNYHFKNEGYITQLEQFAIGQALESGKNVISDNTNLNPKFLQKTLDWLAGTGYEVEMKKFEVSFEEACKRDAARENPVGKSTIKKFFSNYYPEFRKKVDPRIENEKKIDFNGSKKLSIICDIDGTISLMNGRDPFIGQDCESDVPNLPVIDLLKTYKDLYGDYIEIVLFSGRNGDSQLETEIWLNTHKVPMDQLHMRPAGNYEKDNVIKERMYKEHIEGKFQVLFVLDDRDQVVKLWRDELNLPCFQVYYGDF